MTFAKNSIEAKMIFTCMHHDYSILKVVTLDEFSLFISIF